MISIEVLLIDKNNLDNIDIVVNLTGLRTLNVSTNNIIDLPVGLTRLSLLRDLDISYNDITSLQNLCPMSELRSLQVLNVAGNGLPQIPSAIGSLPSLEKLFLNENELESLPPEIGNLGKLIELNLDENKLVRLPSEMGSLQSLQQLNFNQNNLNDLPNEIYSLPLKMFGIDNNPLGDIPPHIVEGGSQEVFDYLGQRQRDCQ